MRLILCLLITFLPTFVLAQVDQDLRDKLIKMAQQNQQVRQSLTAYAPEVVPSQVNKVATQLINLHTQTVKEIVALYGWPDKSLVGAEGVNAAVVLVKHAQDLTFQQDMLPLAIQSYLDGDGITGLDVAELTDTISLAAGKKQVFGTQSKQVNGQTILLPLDNPETVEQLRAQLGLPPLADN